MFTGIIETTGTIAGIRPRGNYKLLTIRPQRRFENLVMGESIAVDGCCLTVTDIAGEGFTVEASQESIAATIVKHYGRKTVVNLERALRPNDRLGGHFVTGHVDCTGEIAALEKKGESLVVAVRFPESFSELIVSKGSVALNGISLTVNNIKGFVFDVNVIPYSLDQTTVGSFKKQAAVNLEFDLIGKYIARMGQLNKGQKSIIDKLTAYGWQ